MTIIDRLEKIGRLILWLTLALGCVILTLGYWRARSDASEQAKQDNARRAAADAEERAAKDAKEAEEKKAPERLTLASMGSFLTAPNYSEGTGSLWFTNTSPRHGHMCVVGVLENANLKGGEITSLPACPNVEPYASAVHVSFMFAGMSAMCPKAGDCRLKVKDF